MVMLDEKPKGENKISPTEDLMREHGVVVRIMLIYKNIIKRLMSNNPLDYRLVSSVLHKTASIAQSFIENYHQKLEEDYLFPRFQQSNKQVDLVNILKQQHDAARSLTHQALQLSPEQFLYYPQYRLQLERVLSSYIHMYEPHTGREDTVLFPAFHEIVAPAEFDKLGERFEEIEEQKFGKNGFENIVNQIAEQEKLLGIYDLSQFTPK